jgi:hypothetical protein
MGTYVRDSGLTVALSNDVITATTAISYSVNNFKSLAINYTINRGTAYRTGVLVIVSNGSTNNLTYTDDYSENVSTGITITVTQTGTNVFVKYISTNTGIDAALTYSVTHLA